MQKRSIHRCPFARSEIGKDRRNGTAERQNVAVLSEAVSGESGCGEGVGWRIGGRGAKDGEAGRMKYTALETSNKINVVSGDSIRKTHRTISHTILRQNGHDSYLLHGRHPPPSTPSAVR
jgi:hypothetical protein